METLIWIAFVLGAGFALVNIYFSAVCTLAHRLREGHWPPVVPMGIPVVGTLHLLTVMLWAPTPAVRLIAALLALLDTGGPIFMLAFVRYRRRRRLEREAASGVHSH